MFAKTRAQNFEFWPNGGHFQDDNIFPIFFQKIDFAQFSQFVPNGDDCY